MHTDTLWLLIVTTLVAALQWWATHLIHRKRLARAQARHLKAQQSTDKMLQQSRQQNTQLQQELAAARLAMKRHQRPQATPAAPVPDARAALMKILDQAPQRRTLPVDGFAETMPSLQFQPSGMGAL
jgi:hypothetical protein